jgi:hydrogenase maturation protein HypF
VDGLRYQRLAHLLPLPMPGGDRAAMEPWRMAAAVLHSHDPQGAAAALRGLVSPDEVPDDVLRGVLALGAGDRTLRTSSAGRLFDAVASLLGLRHCCTFEGQAAMELEALACRSDSQDQARYQLHDNNDATPLRIDLTPDLVGGTRECRTAADASRVARIFHNTLVAALAEAAARAQTRTGLTTLALSGGVLQNRLVHDGLIARLTEAGLRVLVHQQVPPNDGGLSLGQAWAGVLAHHDD